MGLMNRLARLVKPDKVVIPSLPLDNQFVLIGGGVTPVQMSAYMRQADTGDIYNLICQANEFRQKDCHLQAVLATREAALAGLGYSLRPFKAPSENKPSEASDEVSDFVQSALDNCKGRVLKSGVDTKGFNDYIAHLSGGCFYGFAVAEHDWTVDGRMIVPAGFMLTNHRRFEYSSSDGALQWYDESRMKRGVRLQIKYPAKFSQHQPRITGDVSVREGLMYVLLWAALFRNWDIGDWLKLAELSWKPWRIGKYKGSASFEDIQGLITALQNLTSNGIATHSDRVEIGIEWPQRGRGARPEHAVLAEFIGSEMSKAVLGQTLTTETGERGARSLGEIHDRVRKDIMENDARQVASTIERDLIVPLVRLNFGDKAPIPSFEFITEDTPDFGAFMRGLESGVRAGVHIPQAWARDKSGVRHPEPGEEILQGQSVIPPEVEGDDPIMPGTVGSESEDEQDDENESGEAQNENSGDNDE